MSHSILAQTEIAPHLHAKSSFTSPTHDFFQFMFEGADLLSSFWQPVLKSVGRLHLEVAGIGIKHGQAAVKLSQELARSVSPLEAYAAHVRYWEAISAQFAQSQQRIVASSADLSGAPLTSDVVPLVVKRGHDVLELQLDQGSDSASLTRKVA